jgi:hypothetical protein
MPSLIITWISDKRQEKCLVLYCLHCKGRRQDEQFQSKVTAQAMLPKRFRLVEVCQTATTLYYKIIKILLFDPEKLLVFSVLSSLGQNLADKNLLRKLQVFHISLLSYVDNLTT